MVAKDADPSPVYDVVFVVEKTANLVPYFDLLMKSYVQPTLEYFNNGPPDPTDYGHDYSCTLYCVVTFNAGDIAPEPAATCTSPTTSIHELITYLQSLELVGGAGQGSSHIAEGLSTALQVFDNIKTIRYTGVTTQRHCILVCNSPPYHMGAEESNDYRGFNSEQLASMLGKRGIHFSIISPRKIPVLQKMFDAAGAGQGTYTAHPQKDYTTDPRHMVLLHGYQLQEQSHSQKGEEDKQSEVKLTGHSVHSPASSLAPPDAQFKVPSTVISSQPSIHQNTVSPSMMPPNIQAQFNQVNASIIHPSQHPSKQPQGISPQISSLLAQQQPQQGVPQLSEAQAAAVRASMMPKGDITNQPYMTHPGGMSQSPMMGMGGTMAMSTQGMMTAPVAQVAMISPASVLAQQHSQQQQQQQQLLQQQQHQQQMSVGTSLPMSTQPVGMSMSQQPFQTMTNMTMRPPGPQQAVNPNFPSGMAVSSGASSVSVVSNVGPGGTVVTTDARQSLPPPMRDRKIVWTGALEYHEKTKTAQQQRITWLLTCRISIATNEPDLSTVNWPEKLSLQLLPQNMLSELQALCRNSRQVAFHFSNTDQDALRNLHKLMGTGFAGCVHFPPQSASETRIILLLFSAKKRAFIGLIPNDQSAFVQGIKTVLTQHKQRAQPKLLNQLHLGLAQPAMSSLGLVHKQNMPQGQGAVGLDASPLTGGQAAMVTATAGPTGVGGPAQAMLSPQGPGAAPNMQLIDRNLQAAKQRELQFQQQKTQQQQQQQVAADQKNLTMARQQQQQQQQFIDHDMHYPGHPYMYHHGMSFTLFSAQQQQQLRQQGLAAQRMPLQSVQQPNAQLRHLLISQQQQQQMRQQLLMQHGRAPVPQTQQGVMGPGNAAPLQAMTMAQMSGQGTQSYDDFAFTDLV
ncbi:mediator of RNA polymerase II transcription subunit 25-like isoform X4 [Pomacea canaliculata]|uniref:mediator of RNA polymerase II transcription subunit 25-like isoform X4 n=1 Tax=Pomacea canaliculata TaxID=400727 RepID=UPI000D73B7CB|nr:mediator of RNA polymerase II transcription subunit 25-like isoform X4 [Pomacea canaliculata]